MDVRILELTQISKELFSLTAQLSRSPGPASLHADLVAAIRETLQQLDRDLHYAESFIEDVEDIDVREEQRLSIYRIREDFYTHKRLYRRAVNKAQINLQEDRKRRLQDVSTQSANRQENVVSTGRKTRDANASSAVLSASSDVTAELRKTHALMSEELSRTALSQELLDQSSATLERLGEEYNTLGTILNGSKRLLKQLENADRVDQWWIWGSFGFFCLVVSYILYRRILSRPVNALLWTGSFMFSQLNQRKIIEHGMAQKSSLSSVSTARISDSPMIAKTDRDSAEVVDMVIPDLGQDEDEASRLERARVVPEDSHRDDIVHAEL